MKQTRTPRRTYRVDEVSHMLGVPKPTVYRWIAEGTIKVKRVGRLVLVPVCEVDSLLSPERQDYGGRKCQ